MKRIAVSSLVSLFFLSCSVPVSNNGRMPHRDFRWSQYAPTGHQTPLLGGAGVGSPHSSLNFAELEKEYKSFSTKALSDAYVKRMFGKYLAPVNTTQLTRQLEFSRYLKSQSDNTYETSLKSMFSQTPVLYDQMTGIGTISNKMSTESATFGTYVIGLSPYALTPVATDASNITQTSFKANWNTSARATGYKLFVNGSEVYSGASTSFDVTGLTVGTTYTYYVKAFNNAGTSGSSNTISVILNPAIPGVPTTLAATNIGQTSFTANWNSVSGATSYKLKVDSGAFVDVGAVTSYDVTGLTAGTTHTYSLQAVNSSGTSASSGNTSVTLIPATPVATSATSVTATSFTANWNPVSNVTGYKLYINGSEIVLGNITTYNVTGLSPTSNYSYYIKAVNASGDSSNSNTINLSTIEIQLTEIQSIGTLGAFDSEGFIIGADSYLAIANQWDGFYNTDSKIYKWNGAQFSEIQSIATNSAMNWTQFTIGTDNYLALANYCNGATYNMNETIYKWNGSQFVAIQSLPTNGVRNADVFTIGTNYYLVVANFYNDSSYTNQSNIYKWNSTTGKFDTTPIQSISTTGAINWTPFTIGTEHYLALANNYNGSLYNTDSKIYKWNGTQFTEIQSFATNGAYDWEFFTIGSDNYIMVANFSNSSSYLIDSKIYKWNSTTGLFNTTPVQTIPTIGVNDLEFFTIGTEHYLAVANSYTGSSYNTISKIYKWNNSTSRFNTTPIHSINTNGAIDWEYFIIGTKHYLTISNHYNDSIYNLSSKIYRLD